MTLATLTNLRPVRVCTKRERASRLRSDVDVEEEIEQTVSVLFHSFSNISQELRVEPRYISLHKVFFYKTERHTAISIHPGSFHFH